MLLSIIAVVIVLSPIVIIHEFGHYIACRLTGIRVEQFAFGFGKILWHKKVGDTDYQIRLIPFGGFVEPAGPMFHPQDSPNPPKPYEFAAKKWYAKFFMVVNGALFNYLLAAVIFSLLIYVKGMPQNDPVLLPAQVGSVAQGYPAEKIALQAGDLITQINDQAIANWAELTQAVSQRKGDLSLTYQREGQEHHVLLKDADFNPQSPTLLGIVMPEVYTSVPWWKAIGLGIHQCYFWTKFTFTSLGRSFAKRKAPELAGPIGIVNVIHKAVHQSLADFVFLIALLSVAVGMFNLFPIPILDGGYALVFLWEGITHKLPTEKMLNAAITCGACFLILLIIYASYSDIKRIFFASHKSTVEQPVSSQENVAEDAHVQD